MNGSDEDVKPSCRFSSRSPTGGVEGADDVKFSHSAQFLASQQQQPPPPSCCVDEQRTTSRAWLTDTGSGHVPLIYRQDTLTATSTTMFCPCCPLDDPAALQSTAGPVYPEQSSSPRSPSTCWSELDQYYARLNAAECWPRQLAAGPGDDQAAAAAAALLYSVNGFDLGASFTSPTQQVIDVKTF